MKILLTSVFSIFSLFHWPLHNPEIIYQVSNTEAISNGEIDGKLSLAKLSMLGNFGLGTFDQMDGEMVILDGVAYQIKEDGKTQRVSRDLTTPFAQITQFQADFSKTKSDLANYQDLQKYLKMILADNMNYQAIRIEGSFKNLQLKSADSHQQTYPNLSGNNGAKYSSDHANVEGTLVGFYMPNSTKGTGVPGFHFHFISQDRQWGGHLLNCTIDKVNISVDRSAGLEEIPTEGKVNFAKFLGSTQR